ncbi:MAG: hypothetical protein ACTJLL_01720, partial [Anaplasma sp.]
MRVHAVCGKVSAAKGERGEVRAMSVWDRGAAGLRFLFDGVRVTVGSLLKCGLTTVLENDSLVTRSGRGPGLRLF